VLKLSASFRTRSGGTVAGGKVRRLRVTIQRLSTGDCCMLEPCVGRPSVLVCFQAPFSSIESEIAEDGPLHLVDADLPPNRRGGTAKMRRMAWTLATSACSQTDSRVLYTRNFSSSSPLHSLEHPSCILIARTSLELTSPTPPASVPGDPFLTFLALPCGQPAPHPSVCPEDRIPCQLESGQAPLCPTRHWKGGGATHP
jgi:hypothetical protein